MSGHSYQSAILTLNVDDCECKICRFLNGSRTTDDMLEVIQVLDKQLADNEEQVRILRECMLDANRKLNSSWTRQDGQKKS